jgi:hypothetical protein
VDHEFITSPHQVLERINQRQTRTNIGFIQKPSAERVRNRPQLKIGRIRLRIRTFIRSDNMKSASEKIQIPKNWNVRSRAINENWTLEGTSANRINRKINR